MIPSLSSEAGKRLRDDMRHSESADGYAALRQRLVVTAIADRGKRARGRRLALAGAGLVLALLLWFGVSATFRAGDQGALAFRAGESGEPGREGAYYTANASAPLLLSFVEGSRVRIDPGGGLRISGARSARVSIQLETGAARFDVVPRRGAEWEILAGPYRVRVTGTAFWLAWDADAQALDLRMQSGSVLVSGPGIEHGQRVQGTERFVMQMSSSRSSGEAANTSEQPAQPAEEQQRVDASARPEPSSARVAEPSAETSPEVVRRREESPEPATPAETRRRDALAEVEAVERVGTTQFLSTARAEQLMSLADSARFARKSELAAQALQAVRARFGGSRAAASAAFLLGRMAEDAGNSSLALKLYDAHARESGELVPEALGRKMLILHRLGEIESRNRVASEYLERFPNGAYARQARELSSR